jgi:hypothetical protein
MTEGNHQMINTIPWDAIVVLAVSTVIAFIGIAYDKWQAKRRYREVVASWEVVDTSV